MSRVARACCWLPALVWLALSSVALANDPQLSHASTEPKAADPAGDAAKPVTERRPAHLVGVGIQEQLGETLPPDLEFLDERGQRVRLEELFVGNKPFIFTLNYSNCPMLCSLQLDGLVTGLKQVSLELGRDYHIVSVSLDPDETPAIARKTQQRYLKQYGSAEAHSSAELDGAWRFLTGSERNIRALAAALGFSYRYDEDEDQYYHAAAIALTSPDRKLVRYLYGIQYDPDTLELALVEASQGNIGSAVHRVLLFCSAYDPKAGGYGLVASRLVSLGGVLTLGALGGLGLVLWRRERRRHAEEHCRKS